MCNIKDNIISIKKDINDCEIKANRKKNSVILMAVSKARNIDDIKKAYSVGQKDFGENYIQEAIKKIIDLKDFGINWHFIGSVQSNKSKLIAQYFDWIHSIDKISTLKKINDYSNDLKKIMNVCIQVNVDLESTKAGLNIEEVENFLNEASYLKNINLRGLMAIPLQKSDFSLQLKSFKKLKNLFDSLVYKGYKLDTLSIGMSADYRAAIESGSTIIRIGAAIFGERTK